MCFLSWCCSYSSFKMSYSIFSCNVSEGSGRSYKVLKLFECRGMSHRVLDGIRMVYTVLACRGTSYTDFKGIGDNPIGSADRNE